MMPSDMIGNGSKKGEFDDDNVPNWLRGGEENLVEDEGSAINYLIAM